MAVKINGNRGAQQEISVSTKVSKQIIPFQQEFPIYVFDVKNDPIGVPESESDKKPTPAPPNNLRLLTTPTPQPCCQCWSCANTDSVMCCFMVNHFLWSCVYDCVCDTDHESAINIAIIIIIMLRAFVFIVSNRAVAQ